MWIFITLLLVEFVLSAALAYLNLTHLKRSAVAPPQEWAERLDMTQFPRMIAYTTAHTRLGLIASLSNLAVTLAILLSGLLPATARWASALPLPTVGQGLTMLAIPALIAYLATIPWDLASQFGVERRFGFSTITLRTWLLDQAKELLVSLLLGALLGGGLLFLIEQLGRAWWLPAWALFGLFQALMALVAPVILLPLFNKFEPLQDQELAEQIDALAARAHLPLRGVFQMDASRRSTHANAYFTGLGKTRRIVLFDTLLDQLDRDHILAVLAHEIGHWTKRHIPVRVAVSILLSGLGMACVATLLDRPWLYGTLGLDSLYAASGVVGPVAAVGLYLVSILLSPLGLLLAPLVNGLSRRQEFQADAYALRLYDHPTALEEGLILLSEKNLSNLFPHPLVVRFRYSHPPLLERVAAIRAQRAVGDAQGG